MTSPKYPRIRLALEQHQRELIMTLAGGHQERRDYLIRETHRARYALRCLKFQSMGVTAASTRGAYKARASLPLETKMENLIW